MILSRIILKIASFNVSVSPNSECHQIDLFFIVLWESWIAEIWNLTFESYQWEGIRLDGLVLNVGLPTFKHRLTAKLIDLFICLFIQMLWFSENTWLTDWIIWDVVGEENFIQSASAFFSIRSFFFL